MFSSAVSNFCISFVILIMSARKLSKECRIWAIVMGFTVTSLFLRTPLGPRPTLPRAFTSAILSWCVPRYRCAGLQQALLSHMCNTCMEFGIEPLVIIQATRWAFSGSLFQRSRPYPCPCKPDIHCQHITAPPDWSTRSQKRSISPSVGLCFCVIAPFYRTVTQVVIHPLPVNGNV
jgi:hypothetical protein